MALLLMVIPLTEASESGGLQIELLSDEPVTFLFESQPEVSFAGDKLMVKSNDSSEPVQFEIDNVASIKFTKTSGIDDIASAAGITVSNTFDSIIFGNLPDDSQVIVYSLDGRAIVNLRASGEYIFSKNSVNHGIYIVKINSFTTKISI